jgi:hypothetical protein
MRAFLENLFGTGQTIIQLFVVFAALALVVAAWVRTRSIVPTLGALVFGAFMIWASNNMTFIAERIREDIPGQGDPIREIEGAQVGPADPVSVDATAAGSVVIDG